MCIYSIKIIKKEIAPWIVYLFNMGSKIEEAFVASW
jgi:hypothetical protein